MAKKSQTLKNDESKDEEDKGESLYKYITKQFGESLHDATFIVDRPKQIISVSPRLDIALGGGVPEGSLFMLTGPEKIGKTVTALSFCANAQKQNRMIYYGNIEGRLKARDISGISGLSLESDKFKLIGSSEGKILSGEDYLGIFDKLVHGYPNAVGVVDSFSALSAESELTGELIDIQVMSIQKTTAKFCRRVGNVLPVNNFTIVGITHMMANVAGFGSRKTKTEKSGTALKYQTDVKLEASHSEPIKQGDTQIGQKIHWKIITSAIGAPGAKVTSYIKYGIGIWKEMELVDIMDDFSLLQKTGAWYTFPDSTRCNGKTKAAAYLEENPEVYDKYEKEVFEMVGLSQ